MLHGNKISLNIYLEAALGILEAVEKKLILLLSIVNGLNVVGDKYIFVFCLPDVHFSTRRYKVERLYWDV